MKTHNTHNISSSEEGHSYIFSSQTPSDYSKTTNENRFNINKNQENTDYKNFKNKKNILLDENKKNNSQDCGLINDKNELKEKEINNQENKKNVNNNNNEKINKSIIKNDVEHSNEGGKIKNDKKENKFKKSIEKVVKDEKGEEKYNREKKRNNSCKIKENNNENLKQIKEFSFKKMHSFDNIKHPLLDKENIIKSKPNLKNKTKRKKNRLPKIMRCYFTKQDKIIVMNKNIYKEFFANLKNIEFTTSEYLTNIKNEDIENNKEEENNNNININNRSDEGKYYMNDNCDDSKINININNNSNNTIEGNMNSNIKITDNSKDGQNKISSKNKNKYIKNDRKNNYIINNKENQRKSKIKIYTRQNNNNKNSANKNSNKNNKNNLKASFNQIPNNIKRVINSNSQFFNDDKKRDSKEVRVLKFNKSKSILQNMELNNKINLLNKNMKNQNKKSLSISNTPKNMLILNKNESNKKFKIKTTNNDKRTPNKIINMKPEKNYINLNNKNYSNNKIKKKEEDKRKVLMLDSKHPKNIEQNKGNIYSKQDNKILMKRIKNKNNRTIEAMKQNEKIKKNNANKNNEKEKDYSINKINYTNRETTIINNKIGHDIKILSHRTFHKGKNLSKYKFPQINFNKNGRTFENNSNPENLKLDLPTSEKRDKDKLLLSKKSRLNILHNYMEVKKSKKISKMNNIFKDNEKSKRNNMTGSNYIKKINNDKMLFKTIEKPGLYYIKKIKKETGNILSLDKFHIKENLMNNGEIYGQKKYYKKINNFNLNRVRSSYVDKKTLPNFNDLDARINILKNKRNNNSIFLYTKHYGNHNKCPMCQSMEMKAEFSKSKLGLYLGNFKNDHEDSKLCPNYSSIRTNKLLSAKSIKDTKDSRNITFKAELSPINIHSTNYKFFPYSRVQIIFNILKNNGKIDKLEISDFPVFQKYFNS